MIPCKFENPGQFKDPEHLNKPLKAFIILLLLLMKIVNDA